MIWSWPLFILPMHQGAAVVCGYVVLDLMGNTQSGDHGEYNDYKEHNPLTRELTAGNICKLNYVNLTAI